MRKKYQLSNYSELITGILDYPNSNELLNSIDEGDKYGVDRYTTLDVMSAMQCLTPTSSGKTGATLREFQKTSDPNPHGVCSVCILNDLATIDRGGRICPVARPEGRGVKTFSLSPRETEIVSIISSGTTARSDIAKKLGISENTLKNEIGRLLSKLEIETGNKFNSIDAVDYMKKTGLI